MLKAPRLEGDQEVTIPESYQNDAAKGNGYRSPSRFLNPAAETGGTANYGTLESNAFHPHSRIFIGRLDRLLHIRGFDGSAKSPTGEQCIGIGHSTCGAHYAETRPG